MNSVFELQLTSALENNFKWRLLILALIHFGNIRSDKELHVDSSFMAGLYVQSFVTSSCITKINQCGNSKQHVLLPYWFLWMTSLFSTETFLFISISFCLPIYSFLVLFDVVFHAHWMAGRLRRNWLVLSCLVVCLGKVKPSACPSAGVLSKASRIGTPRELTVTWYQNPRLSVIIMNPKWKWRVSEEPGRRMPKQWGMWQGWDRTSLWRCG